MTGSGKSTIPKPTSAVGPTVVVVVAVLLASSGSFCCAATVAVATMVPSELGRTWMFAVALPPNGKLLFKLQITILPINVKLLWVEEAPSTVALEGKMLVTVMKRAVEGPLLVIETV